MNEVHFFSALNACILSLVDIIYKQSNIFYNMMYLLYTYIENANNTFVTRFTKKIYNNV